MLKLKKLLSISLCLILVFSSVGIVSVSASGSASVERSTTIPTVYIQGYGAAIYSDGYDANSRLLFGHGIEFITDGVLTNLLDNIMEPLMKGITTGDYTEYNDYVVNTLVDDLGRLGLDKNGEPTNGSGNFCERPTSLPKKNWYGGKYDLYAYSLTYDWRVDPFVTAKELDSYIQQVKSVTGSSKVNIVGRCLGANIVLAYLSEYGYDDVNAVNFYVPGLEGFEVVGALFSGDITVDSDALDRFLQNNLEDEENELISFLKSFVAILNFINGLNLPIEIVYSIYDQVYYDIIPRVLIESFGSMPAFWSFVGPEYFEAAMELNFSTDEKKAEYAGLIEKINRYHNEVSLKTEDIINNAIDAGVPVYFTAKYGFAAIPLAKESNLHSDGTSSVRSQTFGAYSADVGDTFSSEYLKKAEENGTLKYISPDKCIDASTAILPAHTWFIKNSKHANMPDSVDIMMAQIFEYTGNGERYVTVDDLSQYPQYLYVETDDDSAPLLILTEENADVGEEWNVSIFAHLSNFLEKLFNFITSLVNEILTLINNTEI